MIQTDGQTKVFDWYKEKYPNDDWAIENLNRGITFQDVFECLQVGYDIYALLGAGDSIVRERVFTELATLMDCDYEHIYYQWLDYGQKPLDGVMYRDMTKLRFKR